LPTKTILIDGLLQHRISPPTCWLCLIPGVTPSWEKWIFSQTIKHPEDLTINKVTLKLIIRHYARAWWGAYALKAYKVYFNDKEVAKAPPEKDADGSEDKFEVDVTSVYRLLAGTTPQILTYSCPQNWPGVEEWHEITAYLEFDYSGSEPTPYGASSATEPLPQELLNAIVGFAFMSIMMTMMVGMMTALTSAIGGE